MANSIAQSAEFKRPSMSAGFADLRMEPVAYTIRECAAALRVSERTVRRAIAAGKLGPVLRLGRLVRVPANTLRQFVEGAQSNDPALNSDAVLPAFEEWEREQATGVRA